LAKVEAVAAALLAEGTLTSREVAETCQQAVRNKIRVQAQERAEAAE
jgi:hypothetical protein